MKPPRFHRTDQACGGCSFPLHVADAACSLSPMSESEGDSKLESADAGAEGEDVSGTKSQLIHSPPPLYEGRQGGGASP